MQIAAISPMRVSKVVVRDPRSLMAKAKAKEKVREKAKAKAKVVAKDQAQKVDLR
jgi:hypothetical protein